MEVEVIMQLISTLGFPIFVSVWLLLRSDKMEKRTQELLIELKVSIDKLNASFNHQRGREHV